MQFLELFYKMITSDTPKDHVTGAYNNDVHHDFIAIDVYNDFTAGEHPLYSKVTRYVVRDEPRSKSYRLAAIILGLLSAVFLFIIIGLSVQINRVTVNHDSLFSSVVNSQLAQLRADHKNLIESTKALQDSFEDAKLIKSLRQNLGTNTRLKNEKQTQNRNLQEEKRKLKSLLSNLEENSGECPTHWLLMNRTCYFFAVSDTLPRKDWTGGREECTKKGADLLVIESRDEQDFISDTLRALNYNLPFSYQNGFWMGLTDDQTEGVWKWLSGTIVTEGNWMDGEPNDYMGDEDCAAMYPSVNPMKSWNDMPCAYPLKWICEMKITETPETP